MTHALGAATSRAGAALQTAKEIYLKNKESKVYLRLQCTTARGCGGSGTLARWFPPVRTRNHEPPSSFLLAKPKPSAGCSRPRLGGSPGQPSGRQGPCPAGAPGALGASAKGKGPSAPHAARCVRNPETAGAGAPRPPQTARSAGRSAKPGQSLRQHQENVCRLAKRCRWCFFLETPPPWPRPLGEQPRSPGSAPSLGRTTHSCGARGSPAFSGTGQTSASS